MDNRGPDNCGSTIPHNTCRTYTYTHITYHTIHIYTHHITQHNTHSKLTKQHILLNTSTQQIHKQGSSQSVKEGWITHTSFYAKLSLMNVLKPYFDLNNTTPLYYYLARTLCILNQHIRDRIWPVQSKLNSC